MRRASLALISALASLAGFAAYTPASSEPQAKQLGKVHFATTCTPEAQKLFDRAMLYQHSFWYSASKQAFEEVIKLDPNCAIAYWGIAQSLLLNPFSPPPTANLPEGAAAIEKARSIGAKSARERDFIEALGAFYKDYDKVDHRTRVQSFVKAMDGVSRRNKKDDEAQIFYALALNVAASPADKTYANQLKAAAILERIFKRQPQHPGIAHYLIHTYDYPPIATRGPRRRQTVCEDRPGGPPCAAYAVAHLHARWVLERLHCFKQGVGTHRKARQGSGRSTARDGLPRLCAFATRAGQEGA